MKDYETYKAGKVFNADMSSKLSKPEVSRGAISFLYLVFSSTESSPTLLTGVSVDLTLPNSLAKKINGEVFELISRHLALNTNPAGCLHALS